MTSAGHFTRTVLPAGLARNRCHGTLPLAIAPPLGTHPGIAPLVARRIGELLRTHRLERTDTAVLLVGHGTRRHPASRHSTLAAGRRAPRAVVSPARWRAASWTTSRAPPRRYGTLTRTAVLVIPFLIGGGEHTLDLAPGAGLLPAAAPGRIVIVDRPVGAAPEIVDLIVDLGRRHAPSPAPLRRRAPSRRGSAGAVHLVGARPG